jgi:integrase
VKVAAPGVLTFGEALRLLQCALTDAEGPAMLPFFAICTLSGMRPDEVPRLSGWDDIYLAKEHRLIEVNKAKGGRSRRNVTISESLGRILAWCKEHKLAPNFFSKRKFDRIRKRAGLFDRWQKDLLRHTYASHVYSISKDTKQLAADMGNSERVLHQVYLRPVPRADAAKFATLTLDYSAPREKSVMGCGPKPRKKKR